MRRRPRERARAFNREWGDLATYNAEVARGIVHTPQWTARMTEKQRRYNEEVTLRPDYEPPR